MIRTKRLALALLALAACSRELELPAPAPGNGSCAGRLSAVTVSPALAKVGTELTVSFTAITGADAGATLAVRVGQGARVAVTSAPVSNAYTHGYTVRGDEYAAGATLPAGEEAQVEVILREGTLTCSATAAASVRLDFEPPSIEGLPGVTPPPALSGAPVTIAFTAREELLVPTGSLFGQPIFCSPAVSPRGWGCSATADGSAAEGPHDAVFQLVDRAGNESSAFFTGLVTLDQHGGAAPVISGFAVTPPRATTGTELSIGLTVDRPLPGPPVVLVAGVAAALRSADPGPGGAVSFTFATTVSAGDPEGPATVHVTATDYLGRSTSRSTGAYFDFTAPALASLVTTPSPARLGDRLVLEVTATEPLVSLAASLDGAGPLACAPTEEPERFLCERTVLRTDPPGLLSATLDLVDEAGLAARVSAPAAANLDLACAMDRSRVVLVRGTARSAALEATAGAFEPGATVRVFADALTAAPLAEGVAGPDGSLSALPLPGDPPDVFFDAVTTTTCARQQARHRYVVTLAGKLPFQPVPNPSSAYTASVSSLYPAADEVPGRGRELSQEEYDGAVAIDATRATFSLSAATSRDFRLLTEGIQDCACARASPALAFDEARREVVLFGGDVGAPCGRSPDLWTFSELNGWIEQLPRNSPTPRSFPAMTYDSTRQRTILFGGEVAGILTGSLWEWDGFDWSSPPVSGPSGRKQHALAHDGARGVTVLFGGFDGSGTALADTWEYDGQGWTQAIPAGSSPPARARHGLAYDAARGVTVLYGGTAAVGPSFTDVWEWDGLTWTEVTPAAGGPGPVNDPAMAYNPELRRTLLAANGALWEWDGQAFSEGSFGGFPALGLLAPTRLALARADALGKTLLLDASGNGLPRGCSTGMDLLGIAAPADRPAVLVRFGLGEVAFMPARLVATAVATGSGTDSSGADQPGARLAVLDTSTRTFVFSFENRATEAEPAEARLLSLTAPLDAILAGWVELLLITVHPISSQGGGTLTIDAVELVAED